MEFYYLDGGPFETLNISVGPSPVVGSFGPCTVVGCDPKTTTFLALRPTGETFWGTAAKFDPPPPIPAAARKPQVGEVWRAIGVGPVLLSFYVSKPESENDEWWYLHPHGCGSNIGWCSPGHLLRPATPAEAEPFRPLLDGLKRSLGEA